VRLLLVQQEEPERGATVTEQLTLTPVHATDGAESRAAARKVNAQHQFEQVLLCLYRTSLPMTDDQLAERTGMLRNSAGTRRGVAVRRGLVERAGTSTTPRGNRCATWSLTDRGVRFCADLLRVAS
jgi:hypothetical protein